LCDQKVPKRLKILIYKTVVRPMLLYGAEIWPVTDNLAERVSVCEMRMLYYCLKVTLEKHKTNESIRQEVCECARTDEKKATVVWTYMQKRERG